MGLVLVGLGLFFSLATVSEQPATGALAAPGVVARLGAQLDDDAKLLVVAGAQPDETAFAGAVAEAWKGEGRPVAAVVTGEPRDARAALENLAASGNRLGGIAASAHAAGWLVFASVKDDFPALGDPVVVVPQRHRGSNFLKPDNLLNVANQIAVIAIMAIGMTLVILTGGIDLSVGSLLALAAVLAALFIREFGGADQAGAGAMILACLVAVVVTGLVGLLNGLFVTRFGIPPFLVTLAAMFIASGFAYRITAGESVYQLPDSFTWLGRGETLPGLPNAVVLMFLLYGLAHLLMTRMVIGRHLYAVGGNRAAARLSGVPVERVLLFAYVIGAVLAGLGGVVMASQLKSGSPTYGDMYELYVIAAVVVGGTSLSGGRGSMIGTLVGAFIIAVIQNGMNLMNVDSYSQKIVLGAVVLTAVWLDRLRAGGAGKGEAG